MEGILWNGDCGTTLVCEETSAGREGGTEGGKWMWTAVEKGAEGLEESSRSGWRRAVQGVEEGIGGAERK